MRSVLPILMIPVISLFLPACNTFPTVDTPLMRAAHEGDPALIEALLRQGARPNERDLHQWTALDWAARGGHPLRPHRCSPQDEAHILALRALLKGGAEIDPRDQKGWTPLMMAIHHKQEGAALALIEAGANVSAVADSGLTPLRMAEGEGLPAVVAALKAKGALAARSTD